MLDFSEKRKAHYWKISKEQYLLQSFPSTHLQAHPLSSFQSMYWVLGIDKSMLCLLFWSLELD